LKILEKEFKSVIDLNKHIKLITLLYNSLLQKISICLRRYPWRELRYICSFMMKL